ncbi:MAG: TIR domain-containing protein [Rhodanobacteraceae bacterium]|nr:MAG: TIR domain-containing protein [Rhodanobacteraceae bacterium]
MPAAPTPRPSYRAFISYSHQDKAWADWLHKALETYRVPSRLVGTETPAGTIRPRLNPIFRDRDELASAHDLGRKVNEALTQSANLIVICSPHSAQSRWVNEEVLAYKRMGRAERIFCLIVDGEPDATDKPGHEAEECFAPALRFQLDPNGEPTAERTEPIAADARPGKDGKVNAKLKLIAGMLDVGFDALKQREMQRRTRRMAAITALALVVMAVTSVLAVYALISRHEAVIAQHQAVVAQQAAERRQKQAEGLVGFMLGDLNDKLNQVHRLDIMQAVDDKALAYFASLPTADATDTALAARVTALEKIGSVRMDQGHTAESLSAYQAASALAAELVRRAPGNADREATYGDSLKWIGQAHLYQGDMAHALQDFEAASAVLQRAVAAKPDDGDLAFELAATYHDSGYVLDHRGDFAAAKTEYQAALDIYTRWRVREPAQTRWQSYLGNEYDSLGKLALEEGQLDKAITSYRANQHIKAALAASNPRDHQAQTSLLVSDAILGRTLALTGDMPSALRYTREAANNAKALTGFDPSNSSWQDYYGLYAQQLGGLLRQDGQLDDAATADNDAVRVLSALAAKDPTSSDWPPDLALAQLELARLSLTRHDISSAQTNAESALLIARKLRVKTPGDRSLMLLEAQADTVLGRIAAQRHDAAGAQRDWMQARDLLQPTLRAGNDPNFLAAYVETLLQLGDTESARPIIAKLNAMGYRTPDFVALLAVKRIDYPVNAAFAQRTAETMKSQE